MVPNHQAGFLMDDAGGYIMLYRISWVTYSDEWQIKPRQVLGQSLRQRLNPEISGGAETFPSNHWVCWKKNTSEIQIFDGGNSGKPWFTMVYCRFSHQIWSKLSLPLSQPRCPWHCSWRLSCCAFLNGSIHWNFRNGRLITSSSGIGRIWDL